MSLDSFSLINPKESANQRSIERLVNSTEGGKSIFLRVKHFLTNSDSGIWGIWSSSGKFFRKYFVSFANRLFQRVFKGVGDFEHGRFK